MHYSPRIIVLLLLAVICSATEDSMIDHTLFLAHFNQSIKPEIARGGASVTDENLEINAAAGYAFRHSEALAAGLDLRATSAHIAFPVKGNFNPSQGTLQFFFKPKWTKNGKNFAKIFSLVFHPEKRSIVEQEGCAGFLLTKREGKWILEFRNMSTWADSQIHTDINAWNPDEWHHITMTWKEGGEKILYLDGMKAVSGKYHRLRKTPLEFILSSPSWTNDATACYDELRILDIPLTAAQVAEDYRHLTSGKEFPPRNAMSHLSYLRKDYVPEMPPAAGKEKDEIHTGDSHKVYYIPRPVRMTGDGGDPVWQKLESVPAFRLRNGKTPLAASRFKAVYDNQNLYILAQFDEPHMDRLKANRDQHDIAIYDDDCLEFVLDYGNSAETTIHCAVNVIGGLYDAANNDARYNIRGIRIKGSRQEAGWSVECALPFAGMGASAPVPGEFWGLRVNRERHAVSEVSCWPVLASGVLGARRSLARMQFCGNLDASEELQAELRQTPVLLGLNTVDLSVKNCSAGSFSGTVDVYAISAAGRKKIHSGEIKDLAGGGSRQLHLAIPIRSPEISRLAVEIRSGERILWRDSLESASGSLAISPEALQRKLDAMAVDLACWRCRGPFPYRDLQRNYEKISGVLSHFQEQVEHAIRQKTTLPANILNGLAPQFHGFSKWLDKRCLRVVPGNVWQNGSPADLANRPECGEIRFRQLGNEWSYQALDITGILPGGGGTWRIASSDFFSIPGKHRIGRSKLHIYSMPFIRSPNGSLVTDPLLTSDGNTFYLKAGQTSRMLLAISSRDVEPGHYRGEITLKPLDITAFPRELWPRINILWEVLPRSMPETCDWPIDSFFWNGGDFTPVEDEIPMLSMLESHHVNWIMTNRLRYDRGLQKNGIIVKRQVKNDSRKNGDYWNPENITANDDFLQAARRLKMRVLYGWNTCRNPDWVDAMSRHLQKLGFRPGDYIFSGISDEFSEASYRRQRPFHLKSLARNPEVRWMATLVPYSGMKQEQLEEMVSFIQTPIIHSSILWPLGTPLEKRTRQWLAKRPDIRPWIYKCGMNMAERPALGYYRLYPLQGYLSDVQGVAMWVLVQVNSRHHHQWPGGLTPDAFFDCKDPNQSWQDGIFWWHPGKIILPTRRFIAFSEGLEDVAMIHILKQEIDRVRKKGGKVGAELTDLISRKTLMKLYQEESQKKLDSWHESVFNAISQLYKK